MQLATYQTENEVTADIVKFLRSRGWLANRVQVGLFYTRNGQPIPIGKPGQPDWRFVHPRLGYLEVEMKATGKRPDKRQAEYLATMHALGIHATWADSLATFERWYRSRYGD